MKLALEAANKAMKDASKCIGELGAKNKALKQALAEQHLQDLHDENVRLGLYEQEQGAPVAVDGNTSDGYHTFNELYDFRKAYNAALFNEWAACGKCSVHKSWRHHDGELCFGGGWFIVVAVLPQGQISNHYEANDWDLFAVPETARALFEFDGHTGGDVVSRLKCYTPPPKQEQGEPVACDGDFPDGFNSSFNISAQALRAANSALCDMTGNRQWDVPCLAKHILNFKEQK